MVCRITYTLRPSLSKRCLSKFLFKAFTGDHYRLPLDQHQSLMQRFNFQGYPSYIIINSNGDIVFTTHHIHSLSELDEWLK